jgi:glycosyltransferase involved in cell wall biosynthesis
VELVQREPGRGAPHESDDVKIGFDISQTGALKAGCGYFAQSLIEALTADDVKNQYVLYPAFGTRFWDPDHSTATWRTSRRNVRRGPEGMSHAECVGLWQRGGAALESALQHPDVVHANNFYCPSGLNARVVFTVYDLVVLDHPDYSTEANRLVCVDGLLDAAVNADMLIAISEATRSRFLELFPHYPASRVRTVYPASRFDADQPLSELPSDVRRREFWLAVGTLEPRKNLRRLARAYAALVREWPNTPPLVLAGGAGWLEDDFGRFLDELGISSRVKRLGYVEDSLLAALYANCYGFVYPSLAEGFGLPVLEAMGMGAAAITSNRSSLPEVADNAALTIDPEDEVALTGAMLTLADESVRQSLSNRAQAHARLFSWGKAAKETLAVYEDAISQPRLVDETAAPAPGPRTRLC